MIRNYDLHLLSPVEEVFEWKELKIFSEKKFLKVAKRDGILSILFYIEPK